MSGLYKGLSGLSLFISISLLINYLGHEDYGIWILVFTLFQWVLVMDFGIQSSLKTKIPMLLGKNQKDFIKSYIKTTYTISSYIALIIFIAFVIFTLSLDIKSLLNISFHSRSFVYALFLMNIFFFCVNSVAGIHKSLYIAFLKGKYTEESLVVNQFGTMILIGLAVFIFPDITSEWKLLLISLINGLFCLVVNVFYTVRFFKNEKLDLKTNVKTPKEFVREILNLGYKFMIIQLGMMFFFTIDNYIISNNFGPKEVVPYDTVNKIFQFPIMILFATLAPLWSMFAKDYALHHYEKLFSNFKRFNYYFIGVLLGILVLSLLCPWIISIWIKGNLNIPNYLITYIALVTLIRIFTAFYSYFLNGIGKLNNYTLLICVSVCLKVPVTLFLINKGYGINSVVIATILLMLSWVIFIPLESYNIVKKLKENSRVGL